MNNFAISSDGVGEALKRSASALAAANDTMEESIALATTMNRVEQRSFCSAQNPTSFGVKLAYGVVCAGNQSKEKA